MALGIMEGWDTLDVVVTTTCMAISLHIFILLCTLPEKEFSLVAAF